MLKNSLLYCDEFNESKPRLCGVDVVLVVLLTFRTVDCRVKRYFHSRWFDLKCKSIILLVCSAGHGFANFKETSESFLALGSPLPKHAMPVVHIGTKYMSLDSSA